MGFPEKATLNVHGMLTPEQADSLIKGLKAIKEFNFYVQMWVKLETAPVKKEIELNP